MDQALMLNLTLTDNSGISSGNIYGNAGRVYQVVSGSEGTVNTQELMLMDIVTDANGSYGLLSTRCWFNIY